VLAVCAEAEAAAIATIAAQRLASLKNRRKDMVRILKLVMR
jgi:hypothetical protein